MDGSLDYVEVAAGYPVIVPVIIPYAVLIHPFVGFTVLPAEAFQDVTEDAVWSIHLSPPIPALPVHSDIVTAVADAFLTTHRPDTDSEQHEPSAQRAKEPGEHHLVPLKGSTWFSFARQRLQVTWTGDEVVSLRRLRRNIHWPHSI